MAYRLIHRHCGLAVLVRAYRSNVCFATAWCHETGEARGNKQQPSGFRLVALGGIGLADIQQQSVHPNALLYPVAGHWFTSAASTKIKASVATTSVDSSGSHQTMSSTTPPSTLSAAPVVADA
jgi:hypothetical protein